MNAHSGYFFLHMSAFSTSSLKYCLRTPLQTHFRETQAGELGPSKSRVMILGGQFFYDDELDFGPLIVNSVQSACSVTAR